MARHAKTIGTVREVERFVDRHNLAALRRRLVSVTPKHAGSYNAQRDIIPAYMLNEAGYYVSDNTHWEQTIRVAARMN